jgi:hypothetical protein
VRQHGRQVEAAVKPVAEVREVRASVYKLHRSEVSRFAYAASPMTAAIRGFRGAGAEIAAIDPDTHVGEIMRERSAHIGEGIFAAASGGIPSRGGLRQAGPVQPGDGGGRLAEIEMFGERIGRAGLRLSTADLLFEFSESGFDTPSRKPP